MKTMVMFDLLTAWGFMKQQVVVSIVVALVFAGATDMPLGLIPCLALMFAYSVGFTLAAYDERNDWERFRLTLPLSRANVVQGRYATFVVMTLVGFVLGMAVTAIVYGLSLALPQTELFAGLFEGMDWQIVLGMVAASIAFSLALWLVALPLVARFGMTKAVRYLPLAFIILLPIGTVLVQKAGPPPAFVLDLAAWASTPTGTVTLVAAVLAVMAVLSVTTAQATYAAAERQASRSTSMATV